MRRLEHPLAEAALVGSDRPGDRRTLSGFLFGEPGRRLFGALHLPPGSASSATERWSGLPGVVLCGAIAEEHVRSHRSSVALGFLLAEAGMPTLRFDYYGSGDSQGVSESATRAGWLQDILTAAQELRSRVNPRSVALVGLRFGATLAALSAACVAAESLVLWRPVVNGNDYLTEQVDKYRQWLLGSFARTRPEPSGLEIHGFRLSSTLEQEIRDTDLLRELGAAPPRVLLMRKTLNPHMSGLRERLTRLGAAVDVVAVDGGDPWSADRDISKAFGVYRGQRSAVSWLSRGSRG